MRQTNLNGVDLNLLPALEALIRRRNVTHAASDVGLSQPAMSRALQRLRDALGDPLLVRGLGGLQPTPRALALLPDLSAALDRLGDVYRAPAFEPREMRRMFSIAAADAQSVMITPHLLPLVQERAPGVDLRFEPYRDDLRARMEAGDIDLAFGVMGMPMPPGALNEPLVEDRLALVMRRGHPLAAQDWTLEDYTAALHVTITLRGDDETEVDATLAARGATRRILLRTPHFLAALAAIGASNAISTLSEALATRFSETFGLIVKAPPVPTQPLALSLVSVASRASDPGLVWLKALVVEAARSAFAAGRREFPTGITRLGEAGGS